MGGSFTTSARIVKEVTLPPGLLEFLAATNASTCIQSPSINQKHFFLPPACSSPSNASHWSNIMGAELAEEMEFPSLTLQSRL